MKYVSCRVHDKTPAPQEPAESVLTRGIDQVMNCGNVNQPLTSQPTLCTYFCDPSLS